jgi:cyclophilin family peptidyl-prolyl cis-trans isomerase
MLHGHNGPHADDPAYDLNSFHIHANLAIEVDSQMVTVPQGVGNPPSGGADIHTHDATGELHIHPGAPRTEFVTLGDVFDSWNSFPAPGSPDTLVLSDTQLFDNLVDGAHTLTMTVNGTGVAGEFADYQIHDGDNISLVYAAEGEGVAAPDLVQFAKDLADSGTRFFGAGWCPHCKDQKELFEDGADFLPFIEVTNLDNPVTLNAVGRGEDLTLNPTGVAVNSFPTWEFPDGTRLEGEQSLETLSQRSGVPIPMSNRPFIAPIDDGNPDLNVTVPVDDDGDDVVTLLGGSPLHLAVDGYDPNGGTLSYTVTSSDPNLVSATLLQGNRNMLIDVEGWGMINLQLFEQRAPRPTSRLISLAQSDFYDSVTFHRIVNEFVIQGGDPTGTGGGGSQLGDFDDQFHEELQHNRTGTLSYAKSVDDTNDSQFFITEGATRTLDGNHSVAGVVVEGDKNREAISNNSTDNPRDVVMTSVDIFTDTENAVVMLSAAEGATGTAHVTVTATDQDGNQFSRTFSVNVTPDSTDTSPWLDDLSDQTVASSQTSSIQVQAHDIEGNPIRFGVVTPTNFTIDVPADPITPMSPAVANISITPNAGFIGQEEVTFWVLDGAINTDGFVVDNAFLDSNSTFFDYQTITVASEGSNEGTVNGNVFSDEDRDGVLDSGESGISGVLIFDDANGNGLHDTGERSATTDTNGDYTIALLAGTHTLRKQTASNFLNTTPASVTLTIAADQTLTDVRFGCFEVAQLAGIDLLAATDSGNNTDNTTNFNNSSAATALQFQLSGVTDGAVVRLFSDGTLIHQETASTTSGNFTVTTDGTNPLADGGRSIVATQEIGGVQGATSTALPITVDTVLPGDFTSVPPVSGIESQAISYDANSSEEGPGITYSLDGAPTGATIEAGSGVLAWTPTQDQLGLQQFDVVATDVAGNERRQAVSINVTKEPVIRATLKITSEDDPDASAISEVGVGDTFFMHAFVEDVRDESRGVFAFFHDVVFDENLAAGRSLSFSNNFPNTRAGSILPGEINDIGGVNFDSVGLGPGSFNIYTVEFTATRSGTLDLMGNPPDVSPAHDVLLLGVNGAISSDEVDFGSTRLTINASFGANNDIFNFDEDSSNDLLDVLVNDLSLDGTNDNLTITDVSPIAGQTEIIGDVTIASDGRSLLYTPPADFNGEATFDYMVTDGADTLMANVIVQLHPINDDPVANDDAREVDRSSSSNVLTVLDNDTDIDGDQLRVTAIGPLSGPGNATIASSGSGIQYTPGSNFVGLETFTYTISDDNGGTSQATVSVTVKGAADDSFTVLEESQDNVFDVLENDIGDGLVITAVGETTNGGIVSITNGGTRITYSRPSSDNLFGSDTFNYTATDVNGIDATSVVIVTVEDTNDPPTANDDTLRVTENTSNNTLNVLENDSNLPDAPGEVLSVESIDTTGTLGTVTLVGGVVSYTPPSVFPDTGLSTGTDTFSYTIGDGSGETDAATATVNVVEFVPGSLSGFVYFDTNDNGLQDPGEEPFSGVTISLDGTDDFGNTVSRQVVTGADGSYVFADLAPATIMPYTLTETQPTGERDGVPIVDGQDTIGSQGGTISANDQFTIALAEGVDGTDNNFAELLGRAIEGMAFHDANDDERLFDEAGVLVGAFGNDGVAGGFGLDLIRAGDSTVTFTAAVDAGRFRLNGVPAGDYQLVPQELTFLLPNNSTPATATITDGDSTGNRVTIPGREAQYISLRAIGTASPREFIQASVGPAGTEWYLLGRGWEGFTDASVTMMDSMVHIEATTDDNQTMSADVPMSSPLVQVLGRKDDLELIQVSGSAASLGLETTTTNGASGEGSAVEDHHDDEHDHDAEGEAIQAEGEAAIGEVRIVQPVLGRPTLVHPAPEQVANLSPPPLLQIPSLTADALASTSFEVPATPQFLLPTIELSGPTEFEQADLLARTVEDHREELRYGALADGLSVADAELDEQTVDRIMQEQAEDKEEEANSDDDLEKILDALVSQEIIA